MLDMVNGDLGQAVLKLVPIEMMQFDANPNIAIIQMLNMVAILANIMKYLALKIVICSHVPLVGGRKLSKVLFFQLKGFSI